MSWLQLLHPRVVHGFSQLPVPLRFGQHCVEAVSTITPAPAPTKTFELSYKQYVAGYKAVLRSGACRLRGGGGASPVKQSRTFFRKVPVTSYLLRLYLGFTPHCLHRSPLKSTHLSDSRSPVCRVKRDAGGAEGRRKVTRDWREIGARSREIGARSWRGHADGAAVTAGQPGRSQMRRAHSLASWRQRVSMRSRHCARPSLNLKR